MNIEVHTSSGPVRLIAYTNSGYAQGYLGNVSLVEEANEGEPAAATAATVQEAIDSLMALGLS